MWKSVSESEYVCVCEKMPVCFRLNEHMLGHLILSENCVYRKQFDTNNDETYENAKIKSEMNGI